MLWKAMLDLQQGSQKNFNALQYLRRSRILWFRVSETPIQALHLVSKDYPAVWHSNLEGIALDFGCHSAGEKQTGLFVIGRGGQN